jgi:hypothetical protein
MKHEKWLEFIEAVKTKLPMTPAYQLKIFNQPEYPKTFDEEVDYLGDWSDECLYPYTSIEWIKIKPRMLEHIGMRVPKKVISVEEQLLSILHELNIKYAYSNGNILIESKLLHTST